MISSNDIKKFVEYINNIPIDLIFKISNKNKYNYFMSLDINDIITMLNDYRDKIIKIDYYSSVYTINFEVNDELYEVMKTLFDLKSTINS